MSDALKPIIAAAANGPLDADMAQDAFALLFEGVATPAQIGGLLMAMRTRGETVEEYTAAARIMRAKCNPVVAPEGAMDIVGTGGDGKGTLNISTATAITTAACGVVVAKHGNRNLSSKSGTADALGALGLNVMLSADQVQQVLRATGIGFMMAPMHHPAMAHVGPARAELGTRTIFNILGPLTNPAGVKRQLTGAFSRDMLRPMAQTLRALGSEAAWLVHGSDGTDELSIAGPSAVCALDPSGDLRDLTITPADAGLPTHPFEDLIGGAPDYNAQRIHDLFAGQKDAYRDAVLLNTAAALVVAGAAADLPAGAAKAAEAIDSGAAAAKLAALAAKTQEFTT